jgi:hypothetical protein
MVPLREKSPRGVNDYTAVTDSTPSRGGREETEVTAVVPPREKSPRGVIEQGSPTQRRPAQLKVTVELTVPP